MATIFERQQEVFGNKVARNGTSIRLRYFTGSVSNTGFDDAQVLSRSGNDVWCSGLVMPVNERDINSSVETVKTQQGKLTTTDKKVYVKGDVVTTDTMRFGIGSPTSTEHSLIPEGVQTQPAFEPFVYKKIYLRELPTGRLIGEE